MTGASPDLDAARHTSPDMLAPREDLVAARTGPWRMRLPLRHVERVFAAAMPAARPSAPAAAPVVAIDGALVPVVFSGALVIGWSGADRPLAVLDVPRLVSLVE